MFILSHVKLSFHIAMIYMYFIFTYKETGNEATLSTTYGEYSIY